MLITLVGEFQCNYCCCFLSAGSINYLFLKVTLGVCFRLFSFLISQGLDLNKKFLRKIVSIFLPIILAYFLVAQKDCLIETFLLSTHNICFD